MSLLSLPRDIGKHPETDEMIQAGIGRYGPYLKYAGKFISLPAGDDVLTVGMNRAVDIIAQAASKPKKTKKPSTKKKATKKKTTKKKKSE